MQQEKDIVISRLKECIAVHMNPYNLGDEGETTKLINDLIRLSQHPSNGAVWVKASNRLPQSFQAMYVRIEKVKSIASWHPHHEMFIDDAGDFHPADQIEWLDESPAEQPGREVKAETFAKFLDEQRNNHTADMWADKAIWSKPTAFQEWLKYFNQQNRNK